MKYTIEEKYKYLLSCLEVSGIDYYEQDAMLGMPKAYFQFTPDTYPVTNDAAVESAMDDWYRNTKCGTQDYIGYLDA